MTTEHQIVAIDREEDEPCQRGTIGCCIDHEASRGSSPRQEGKCETW